MAYLFDWIYSLPSWASSIVLPEGTFYFASKTKAIEELPLLTDKLDTMYRHYKSLEDAELIKLIKLDGKDYVSLTEKAKKWGRASADSEKFPSKSGKKSEKSPEKFPTYKTTIPDKNTNDKKLALTKREIAFRSEVMIPLFNAEYSNEMRLEFCDYWTEPNKSLTKMRWEQESVFDIRRRLATWAKRDNGFKKHSNGGGDFFATHI